MNIVGVVPSNKPHNHKMIEMNTTINGMFLQIQKEFPIIFMNILFADMCAAIKNVNIPIC